MDDARCRSMLKVHEGKRLRMYPDTKGIPTIGYGRNLRDPGISEEEAEVLFVADFGRAIKAARAVVPGFDSLDDIRQEAFVDMAFNLGPMGLAKFTKMLNAVARHAWNEAAQEARESDWYLQVKGRGEEIAMMIETGEAP